MKRIEQILRDIAGVPPAPERPPKKIQALEAIGDFVKSYEPTGWWKDHEYQKAEWGAMRARGGEDLAQAQQEEAMYNARLDVLASELNRNPPHYDEDGNELTHRERTKEREKLLKKIRDRDYLPTPEITQLNSAEPLLTDSFNLFNDGVGHALRDPTVYSEFAVREPIPGFENDEFQLLPHQREGLGMMEHALRKYGGALEADQMGVGKTLILVAVILRRSRCLRAEGKKGNFLVVLTPPLLQNWLNELERAPELKVHVYHQTEGKKVTEVELKDADVVITTYDTLVHEWRGIKQAEVAFHAAWKGETLLRESMAQTQEKEWAEDCKRAGVPYEFDVKVGKLPVQRVNAPLFNVDWEYLTADEAHHIRNKIGRRSQAMSDIPSNGRIAVTGTPMQNNRWEMYTLFRFLRIRP